MEGLKVLANEMARKRKALAASKPPQGKKFIKRSELTGPAFKSSAQRARQDSESSVPESDLPSSLVSPTFQAPVEDSPIFSIPRAEVVRRLREREEPIRVFGETDRDVCLRLRQIEILAPEVNKGLRNDLKDAMDQLDQEYLDQIAKQEEDGVEHTEFIDDGTTMEVLTVLVDELKKGDESKNQEIVLKTLKFLLREWSKELNLRPTVEKRSYQGKMASATHKQTESYLEPLFKSLKKKNTMTDILQHLANICYQLVQREYVKANDAYLQMAIGNAPWPIGVTMVGIHARTGREKIFAQHVAHVLNDETQRKYIQGLKRLMTFCQRRFVTDPSKCVEYQPTT